MPSDDTIRVLLIDDGTWSCSSIRPWSL